MADPYIESFHKNDKPLKNFLIRLLEKWPWLYFRVYEVYYERKIQKAAELIVVTTPGHVGSSTVFRSLQAVDWQDSALIFNIHSLQERFNNSSKIHSISARHVLQEVLRKNLRQGKLDDKSIRVITLIRDPLARALGGMFQNPAVFLNDIFPNRLTQTDFPEACHRLKEYMMSGYLLSTMNWQLSFYTRELMDFWRLDLSIEPQNTETGFIHLKRKNSDCLVFTLEDLGEKFISKVKLYFEKDVELINSNRNEQRQDGRNEFYNYCKEHLKFDQDILRFAYDHPLMKNIYSSVQLEEFRKRWS